MAALAWALSQIGPQRRDKTVLRSPALPRSALAALAGYALWERVSAASDDAAAACSANRAFVGLNVATLLLYGGLAIMFFLLVVRSHRPPRH